MIYYIKRKFNLVLKSDSKLGKRLAKNSFIGMFGSLFDSAMGVLRTAILAKSIPLVDFGKIYIILNFYSLLITFFSVRVNDVLFRFLPQLQNDNRTDAVNALVSLCVTISLCLGLVLFIGTFSLSSWISIHFYEDANLASAFKTYALVLLIISFDGFNTAILRLHDRFALLIFPRLLGSFLSLTLISVYIYQHTGNYSIEFIIMVFAIGNGIGSLLPFLFSLKLLKIQIPIVYKKSQIIALKPIKFLLLSNLFHTNLVGYLKIASDTGGMFLLGIVAGPTQVAFFNIAKQLTQPLKLLKDNIQNAFTPEIMKMWTMGQFNRLYSILKRYEKFALIVGGIFFILVIILIKPILLLVSTREYFGAISTVIVLYVALFINFSFTLCYPLTVAMDKMPKRNAIVSLRIIYLLIGLAIGLSSFSLSLVHLAGVLTVRIFSDIPVLRHFKRKLVTNTDQGSI
jgi:O-antigen/teichoic acid export membrane protein